MTLQWKEVSEEEQTAYEARPETIEYRASQRRAAANARLHCTCGRFAKYVRTVHGAILVDCTEHGRVGI